MPEDEFGVFLTKAFTNAYDHMKKGASFYIWHADSNGLIFREAAEETGLKIHQVLIWVKSHFTVGRQDYQWKHEPCLYGWKEGGAHYFIDLRSLNTISEQKESLDSLNQDQLKEIIEKINEEMSTVNHAAKPNVSDLHPTTKPISIIKKHIRNSSREGDVVLDLFGGSGTTLMACEEMGRVCHTMEYDPRFCDVIIKRWESETGRKAKKNKEK